MNVLVLHFRDSTVPAGLEVAFRRVTQVGFRLERREINPLDMLTKPECADAGCAVAVIFDSQEDCRAFMVNRECRRVYEEFSAPQEQAA
jgi:hypothetical protein